MKKYDIFLSNREAIFDSASGFDTAEEAIDWGLGRGMRYVMQIGKEDEETIGVDNCHFCNPFWPRGLLFWLPKTP